MCLNAGSAWKVCVIMLDCCDLEWEVGGSRV